MKSIVFLLPCPATVPVGGFKVVYEYANRLVEEDYLVHIVYSDAIATGKLSIKEHICRMLNYWRQKLSKSYLPSRWFKLDGRIRQYLVPSLAQKNVPKADFYVATSWETAEYLMEYENILNQRKFYLIQHYECWGCSDENRLLNTWKSDLHKIVISPWLKDIATNLGIKVSLVENGFDFNKFRICKDVEVRNPCSVVMLYHEVEWKGVADAFEALKIVQERYPHMIVNIFGVYSKPKDVPFNYVYYQQPSQTLLCQIYNESAIYVGASHVEGWGLTVGEAMQCGCAVACTDNGGYSVMAHDGDTALVSPVKDPKALAKNIIHLMEDKDLRVRIAKRGNENIRQYTWERAFFKFKSILEYEEIVNK